MAALRAIDFKDLCLIRGQKPLFAELSFLLQAGHMTVIKGKNGCGKSSLLRAIMGFIPFAQGTIQCQTDSSKISFDQTFCNLDDYVTYLGHKNGLKANFSLIENLNNHYQFAYGHTAPKGHIEKTAAHLGMTHLLYDPVHYFSSGQTRRASLLRFPLLNKTVWIMDEPTVGLDHNSRLQLGDMIQGHLDTGGMVLAVSHDDIDLPHTSIQIEDYQNITQISDSHDVMDWLTE